MSNSCARSNIGIQPRKLITKTRAGPIESGFPVNWVFCNKKRSLWVGAPLIRNSCRQRRSALLRRTEKLIMSVLDLLAERRECSFVWAPWSLHEDI